MNAGLTAVLIPLLLGGIFAVIGIALLVFGRRERSKARATEKWPTVSGTVVGSRTEQQTRTERSQGRTYTRTTYAPVVEYTYEAGGKTFHGNRIFAGSGMSYDLGTAQGIINRYQPGQTATVHFDPADPTQAVLETQAKGGATFLIIGGVFLAVGLVACCVAGGLALTGRS